MRYYCTEARPRRRFEWSSPLSPSPSVRHRFGPSTARLPSSHAHKWTRHSQRPRCPEEIRKPSDLNGRGQTRPIMAGFIHRACLAEAVLTALVAPSRVAELRVVVSTKRLIAIAAPPRDHSVAQPTRVKCTRRSDGEQARDWMHAAIVPQQLSERLRVHEIRSDLRRAHRAQPPGEARRW